MHRLQLHEARPAVISADGMHCQVTSEASQGKLKSHLLTIVCVMKCHIHSSGMLYISLAHVTGTEPLRALAPRTIRNPTLKNIQLCTPDKMRQSRLPTDTNPCISYCSVVTPF